MATPETKDNIWFKVVCIFLTCSVMINIYLITNNRGVNVLGFLNRDSDSNVSEITRLCNNLSLPDTMKCMNKEVKSFFKYNFSNSDVPFEELKEYGGNCVAWSIFWADSMETLGFRNRFVIIPMSEKLSHEVVIVFDEDDYCLVDQRYYTCGKITYGEELK